MPSRFNDAALVDALGSLASEAGRRIMSHYGGAARIKSDGSPVTAADHEAEEVILEGLARLLPGVPVLAEESAAAGRLPDSTDLFVAVDPMDGTREFIGGNGEFTVNIALIAGGTPVAGIVAAPALDQLWLGLGQTAEAMRLAPGRPIADATDRRRIATRPLPPEGPLALVSRSHPDLDSEGYLVSHGVAGRLPVGSSLKYTMIAEGRADLSVRFASISEWDIAAAHAVLQGAGGIMRRPDGAPLVYGRADRSFRTDAFVASSAAFRERWPFPDA
ncbi:MAG: 3'(2'),5'-bisphosphate nucleotidase CysQ [Phreatobacter sp.]|uniref:3'(2'),5'-bisphosphate nucleotidase CysQ family protein n=1 Tax=Phreatobacter sp. TaxID=1966341 RepID=UPI001A41D84C|nr:3'(2'),5'-bisphosphate nucleotidase CysQ [Phreatobacter sp.]MBL8569181.1 3'(2'),5'-bisphosphate nucleotidase CysQ [Phreatobacter sp.]